MSLKDLLVYVDQSERACARLRLAADLARRHKSRLTALYDQEWTVRQREQLNSAQLGLASPQGIDSLNLDVCHSIDEAAQRLRAALEASAHEHHIETEWRCLDGAASAIVPRHARVADLCILAHDMKADGATSACTVSEHVLFGSGRPVLCVPASGSLDTLERHVLVAWNSSRAAARALNDALALIERAEHCASDGLLEMPPPNRVKRTRIGGGVAVLYLSAHADRDKYAAVTALDQQSDLFIVLADDLSELGDVLHRRTIHRKHDVALPNSRLGGAALCVLDD